MAGLLHPVSFVAPHVVLLFLLCVTSLMKGLSTVSACFINGFDIGYCDASIMEDEEARLVALPFCGTFVRYVPCVPRYDPLPPTREHPDGRWTTNTARKKDEWVQSLFEEVLAERLAIEGDKNLQKKGIDEFGDRGAPVPRFSHNQDCQDAYRNYLCWSNFPSCDEKGESMPLCRSVCENMMIACQYESDLWRCGESEYFNGYGPEDPTIVDGVLRYLRDFFPGQPFVSNQFESSRGKDPIPVCTPSLDGGATALQVPIMLQMMAAVGIFALYFCAW
jgi:hypothetical protein